MVAEVEQLTIGQGNTGGAGGGAAGGGGRQGGTGGSGRVIVHEAAISEVRAGGVWSMEEVYDNVLAGTWS